MAVVNLCFFVGSPLHGNAGSGGGRIQIPPGRASRPTNHAAGSWGKPQTREPKRSCMLRQWQCFTHFVLSKSLHVGARSFTSISSLPSAAALLGECEDEAQRTGADFLPARL